MNPALQLFRDTLPARPYMSNDPRRGVWIRPREVALKAKYVQLNAPWAAASLPFDVDREGAAFSAEDAGIPSPSLTIVNPRTAHAHLLYLLKQPATRGNPRLDWLLAAVRSGLAEMLGADPSYGGGLIQNPLHPCWYTLATDFTYNLSDLAWIVPENLLRPRRPTEVHTLDIASRNVDLFERSRRVAYRLVGGCESDRELHAKVLDFCAVSNVYRPPLPSSEVRSVARSISRWTWRHRAFLRLSDKVKRRGILGFPAIIETDPSARLAEIRRRQSCGAGYTNQSLNVRLKQMHDQRASAIRALLTSPFHLGGGGRLRSLYS